MLVQARANSIPIFNDTKIKSKTPSDEHFESLKLLAKAVACEA
jgi:hypothetical protein